MTKLVMLVALLLDTQSAHDPEHDTNVICGSVCDGKGERCFQRCVMCALGSGEQHSVCLETCHENHVWGTAESASCMNRCIK